MPPHSVTVVRIRTGAATTRAGIEPVDGHGPGGLVGEDTGRARKACL